MKDKSDQEKANKSAANDGGSLYVENASSREGRPGMSSFPYLSSLRTAQAWIFEYERHKPLPKVNCRLCLVALLDANGPRLPRAAVMTQYVKEDIDGFVSSL